MKTTTVLAIASAVCLASSLAAQQSEPMQDTTPGQSMDQGQTENRGPNQQTPEGQPRMTTSTTNAAQVEAIIAQWKEKPREVAQKTIQKYGTPDEVSTNRLAWNRPGPWKFTEVVNEEITHNFPKPHKDMLRQGIALDVPVEKFTELAAYDGSVIVERTKGELSARCDKEEMNFLALNLAHDIIEGKLTVEEARKQYAQTAAQFMKGERPHYTTGLHFMRPVSDEAGDPDKPMVVEGMKGLLK